MTDNFFNSPSSGFIDTHDANGKITNIPIKKLRFRPSVYGVLKFENKILLSWNPFIKKYVLPGGGIELGETIESSLIREFKEETGLNVKIRNLIDVKEDFFNFGKEYAQGILIFYNMQKVGGTLLKNGNNYDSGKTEYVDKNAYQMNDLAEIFKDVVLNSYH